MKANLVQELETTLKRFFSTSTDREFWAAIEHADKGIYSKIRIPLIDIHERFQDFEHEIVYYCPVQPVTATTSPCAELEALRYSEITPPGALSLVGADMALAA